MIVYDLICARQHRFEGWFGSAADFTRQRDDALIRCPLCDDASIQRRPSANIQVGRAPEAPAAQSEPKSEGHAAQAAGGPMTGGDAAQAAGMPMTAGDAKVLALLRKLVAETDNVGRAFAEEARKIHYDEAPKRGIRGQATSEEADALREEGIDFMSLPAILTRDLS
ncbi:MAG TPA: DUF1178 family protein [Casimicrobiaceae bacterium]|nr:DUF1178 family protein [Casimicrobiaceae bacterium]